MDGLDYLLDQIPIRHNFYSALMLGGIIQGFFLASIILFRTKLKQQSMQLLFAYLIVISLISLDVYLCYTGVMKYVLWLNDSTEFLVLFIGPIIYLFLVNILERRPIRWKQHGWHLLVPPIYLLLKLGYLLQGNAVKLNAYIAAFFPHLDRPPYPDSSFLLFSEAIGDYWRWIMFISLSTYTFLSLHVFWRNRHSIKITQGGLFQTDRHRFAFSVLLILIIVFTIIYLVYSQFERDLGDHIIIIVSGICVYVTSFIIMSESRFLGDTWLADKYDTSGLKEDPKHILQKVEALLKKEQPHLEIGFTLKKLSQLVGIPANYISQSIMHEKQISYNDFVNQYRIEKAKKRLAQAEFAHLSIAGIGESVGFKSKTAFYNAFKKFTHTTPAQYARRAANGGGGRAAL